MTRRALAACAAAILLTLTAAPANASTGPPRLQKLAEEQTQLLYRYYSEGIPISPAECGRGQDQDGVRGAFLLPTRSFSPDDTDQKCTTRARSVLVDLGGATVTEDATGNTWTFADGTEVPFRRKHLEAICDDVLARGFVTPSPGTLDGAPITPVPVSTGAFTVKVREDAGPPYADSKALGHPGRLATAYCGYKAELEVKRGKHVVVVDHSEAFRAPAVSTYRLRVR